MKNNFFFSLILLFSVSLIFFSCASSEKIDGSENYVPDENDFIYIPVPSSVKTFFGSVNQQAVALVEEGSPDSLRKAFSVLHQSDKENYSEKEMILLFTAYKIMKIVWPSESLNYEPFAVSQDNPYYGAITSAERGIYDTSTGNEDFLSTVLPSLVLITGGIKEEYSELSRSALTSALKMKPHSTLVNYLYGRWLYLQGRSEESIFYYNMAMSGSPQNVEIRSASALSLYAAGQYDDAFSLAEKVLAVQKQNVEMLKIAARVSYLKGNRDTAQAYVLRILELQPENTEYLLFRARLLMDYQDYIRASSILDTYGRMDQVSRDYLLLKARLAQEWNKNTSSAASFIGKAVELYPSDEEVLLEASRIASANNSLVGGRTAIDLANEVLSIDSENSQALEVCITEMTKQNAWTDAYDFSRILVSRNGVTDGQKRTHVSICLTLGYIKEAQPIAEELYAAHPEDNDNVCTYIEMLVGTKQTKKALKFINSLLENEGVDQKMKSFLYYQRSFIVTGQEAAINDLRSSLSANPRNRDTLFRLYQIYYNRGEYKRAQYYIKQLVSLEPTNTSLSALNAELDRLQGK